MAYANKGSWRLGLLCQSVALFFLFSVAAGCAGKGSVSTRSATAGGGKAPSFELDEELEAELRHVPTDFEIGIPENRYAWERAQLFFKEHTSGGRFVAGRADAVTLSNEGSADTVLYKIEKRPADVGGSRFIFTCTAGRLPVPAATLSVQCRNLARFVQQGFLEKSLIIR